MFLEELPKQVILLKAGTTIPAKTLDTWSKALKKEKIKLNAADVDDKLSIEPSVYIIDLSHRDDEVSILESVAKFSDKNHRLVVLANGNTKHVMNLAKNLQRKDTFPVAKNCHIATFPKHNEDFVSWLEKILLNKPRPTPAFTRSAIL